jgi:hypothetical protein
MSVNTMQAAEQLKNATHSVAKKPVSTWTIALFGALLLAAGSAQAQDVRWSVSVGSHLPAPRPVVVYQQPQVVYQQPQVVYLPPPQVVYQQPQVIYQQPQVIYQQPQVVYQQPPVVYQQPPRVVYQPPQQVYYVPPYWRHGRHHGHHDDEGDRGYGRTRVMLRVAASD